MSRGAWVLDDSCGLLYAAHGLLGWHVLTVNVRCVL
jgi:hypothetical protein